MISFVSAYCVIPTSTASQLSARKVPLKSPHLFVFGLGYVGLPLAVKVKQMGFTVSGTTRSENSSAVATACSVPSLPTLHISSDHLNHFVHQNLEKATHVLSTVPPDAEGDPILRAFEHTISSAATLAWLGYISSTSVYGNHNGAWVDETSPCLNPSQKGRRRLDAEGAWSQLAAKANCASFIFRLSGIYGPRRSALHTLHRNPTALADTSDTKDMLVSRAHLTDIVDALAAATTIVDKRCTSQVEIVNVSDDRPASRREVFQYAAEIMKLESKSNPSKLPLEVPSMRHRDRSSKKVSNAKMKRLLLPNLKYPSFREGLDSLS